MSEIKDIAIKIAKQKEKALLLYIASRGLNIKLFKNNITSKDRIDPAVEREVEFISSSNEKLELETTATNGKMIIASESIGDYEPNMTYDLDSLIKSKNGFEVFINITDVKNGSKIELTDFNVSFSIQSSTKKDYFSKIRKYKLMRFA